MPRTSTVSLLHSADRRGWDCAAQIQRSERAESGQFFSPELVARFLASWFSVESLNQPKIHLLDPGAGGGALTAAVVDRICRLHSEGLLPRLKHVTLTTWELDDRLQQALTSTLHECATSLQEIGILAKTQLHRGNYLLEAAAAQDNSLFLSSLEPTATHAILNPPYQKLSKSSTERQFLGQISMDTGNLYSAFVWLALRQLLPNGELAAITPRSFCNGPYFMDFRKGILSEATLERVHIIDSRTEAFERDAVLQENILFKLRKESSKRVKTVSISTGSLETPTTTEVPYARIVLPSDSTQVIHLSISEEDRAIAAYFTSIPATLADLGLEISTGPIVDFRLRKFLSDRLDTDCAPLLYPHSLRRARVLPPPPSSDAYSDKRMAKKPVAIRVCEETLPWLLGTHCFILIKRFTSKEERRRLVTAVLDPADFQHDRIGLENHLNFIHQNRRSVPLHLAMGLSRFLNSTHADHYFRQFNGHTQVNATDIRNFRFPSQEHLEKLGRLKLDDTDQEALDAALEKHLGAPILTDSKQ